MKKWLTLKCLFHLFINIIESYLKKSKTIEIYSTCLQTPETTNGNSLASFFPRPIIMHYFLN